MGVRFKTDTGTDANTVTSTDPQTTSVGPAVHPAERLRAASHVRAGVMREIDE